MVPDENLKAFTKNHGSVDDVDEDNNFRNVEEDTAIDCNEPKSIEATNSKNDQIADTMKPTDSPNGSVDLYELICCSLYEIFVSQ